MKTRMKLWIFCLFACSAFLWSDDVTVQAQGMGSSYRNAVKEALVTALEQQTGLEMSTVSRSKLFDSEKLTTTTAKGNQEEFVSEDVLLKEISVFAKGRISGYTVVSKDYNPATKKYSVELAVRIPGPYILGQTSGNRRMVIGDFYANTKEFSVNGMRLGTNDWTRRFVDNLTIYLTQTRKFTMLERKFDAAVNAEFKQLSSANMAVGENVRLHQKLATDYLIVGTVSFFNTTAVVNPFTGQALPSSGVFAEIFYRVILVPTGQLKWTDSVKVDAADYAGMGSGTLLVSSCEHAAARVGDAIMSNIYPLEVAKVMDKETIVIAEGGKSVHVGEYFAVYELGEEVADPRTGTVLDAVEKRIALVQVSQVLPKMSYAHILDGESSKIKPGDRLRREWVIPKEAGNSLGPMGNQALPGSSVKGMQNGGVITPF